jgi:hypothetical protein
LRSFFAGQAAPEEDSEQRSISLALERIRVRHLPELFGLVDGEPVTKTNAELLWPLDPPDAGCKIRAEKAGISGLVCKPTYGREPAINCARRELPCFQVNSVASDNRFVERQGAPGPRSGVRGNVVEGRCR